MASLYTFTIKTPAEIRDDILRTIKNGLLSRGVSDPNVGPNSDYYILATALANELAVVEANAQVMADQQMFDTASDEDLDRLAAVIGLSRRAAAGGSGFVVLTSSGSTPVTVGTQLQDSLGNRYEVTTGGVYTNGALIPISGVDTGPETNLSAGASLSWVSAPPYSAPTAAVATGGLTNGTDEEGDEALRERCFARLRNPPAAGNWEHVAEMAEASHPSVQKAFVYPALQGAGTVHAVVTAAPTSSSKSRVLSSTLTSITVGPYVKGKMPEHVEVTVQNTVDVNTDVSFSLSLPASPTASPPGPGGGWVDGTPWPIGSTTGGDPAVTVTTVSDERNITVDAAIAPVPVGAGGTIAWLSPYDWKLYTAKILQSGGSAGAYNLGLDRPLPGITVGCYIWPACQNAQAYVDAVLAQFALMGPGEKTSNTSDLVRGYRHPAPSTSWPYSLGAQMLKAITTAGSEVLEATYRYRSTTTPAVPGSVGTAPNILIPRHIGFYPAT